MMPDETLTHQLARFAASLRYDDLPPDVVSMAKQLVLDTLGTSLAATTLGSGCAEVTRVVSDLGGKKESTIIGHPVKVPAPNAALANGALAHALNYDAIGPEVGHVGVVAFTAPLAAAEARAVSGREFLAAVAVAGEVTARLTAAIAPHEAQRNPAFLRGQFLGYLGAAAGAGRAMGLGTEQMHSAFGLALMQSSGSSQVVIGGDPPAKSIYGAFPNHGGVLAALLSDAGLGAACDAVDGTAGVHGMITNGAADRNVLVEGLGTEFLLLQTEFKMWPMSAVVHPFVAAALGLSRDVPVGEIDRVEITYPGHIRAWCEPLEERRHPGNAGAGANSVIFGVAKSLVHGAVTLADFGKPGLEDVAASRLADRIGCRLDDMNEGSIAVVTNAGRRHEVSIGRMLGNGAPSTKRLTAKFRDCCTYSAVPLSSEEVTRIIDTLENIEQIPDIAALTLLIGGNG